MKLSTPPVSPSARPRNSENEPSVTIKGGNPAAGDQEAVHAAGQRAQDQRQRRGRADRQPGVAPELAEDDGREAHQRADRQVDAAADDHRRQGHGQQADLDAQPQHLEGVGQR